VKILGSFSNEKLKPKSQFALHLRRDTTNKTSLISHLSAYFMTLYLFVPIDFTCNIYIGHNLVWGTHIHY